jgi:hypothetical protein
MRFSFLNIFDPWLVESANAEPTKNGGLIIYLQNVVILPKEL